jgi:Tfp pilus assembly protein PilO
VLQSKTARWSTGTALLCVALLTIAWFLVVSPRQARAAEIQAAVLTQQQQNDQLRITVEQLKAEFVQLPATRAKLAEIRNQLPPTTDVPGLLRTVEALATTAGVKLVSFAPGASQPLVAAGAGGAATAGQATPAALMAVPLTLMVTGQYFQVVTFLRQLQTGVPRAFLISGLQIGKADDSSGDSSGGTAGGVSVTISAKVFSMPTSATAEAATVPAVTASPSVAASTTPTPTVTTSVPSPSTGAIALPLPQTAGSPRW